MESRLEVMLAAVKIVRPALDGFYQSLSDEQKARFNAVAPTDGVAAGKDQRDFAEKAYPFGSGATKYGDRRRLAV